MRAEVSTLRRTGEDVVERKSHMPGYTGFIRNGAVSLPKSRRTSNASAPDPYHAAEVGDHWGVDWRIVEYTASTNPELSTSAKEGLQIREFNTVAPLFII